MKTCRFTPSSLLSLIVFTITAISVAAEMHTWTNLTGQQIQGEMTGMDVAARAVKVRRKDGLEFNLPIANLSAEDIAYASALWRQMQASGAVPAAAAAAPAAPQGSVLNLKLLPPRFIARTSAATRLAAIRSNGGDDRIEAAVMKSLDRLKTVQKADGGWGAGSPAGYTGLALQCFTGHGEGLDSPVYGATVQKACDALLQMAASNPEGMLSAETKSGGSTYAHGIATTALGEVFILAKAGSRMPPTLQPTFQKAVQLIIDSQNKLGSWTYGGIQAGQPTAYNNTSGGNDLSLTNWQLQALVVAKEAGLQVSGLDSCVRKALNYLESKQTKMGGFGGIRPDAHYNQWHMSGGAILGLQMLGSAAKGSKGVRFLRESLTQEPPDWQKNFNLYSWSSNTPAFFNAGGDDWKFYVSSVIPQILAAQSADGGFEKGRASWPAAQALDADYRHALCTLQLEVFYRYAK